MSKFDELLTARTGTPEQRARAHIGALHHEIDMLLREGTSLRIVVNALAADVGVAPEIVQQALLDARLIHKGQATKAPRKKRAAASTDPVATAGEAS
ncbi:hypothetical protein THIX_30720 [Thiomonas sp. X19]|uniref:hypothetical protein n=1 Tax=Thiomonas sp. X19 TaxID=1050370 RepID=UPI000B713F14|nr:hypothetical protein [Thiomonas sp. X19]SCC93492.1 hypothetical protein THIX_30720 [Thiomonas sp. X19]